ncbi:MAG: 50S ribosomal protein L9 [Parcubacteria group bacterium]
MKIILLKDVPKIGKKYDIKDVSDGYALNMLIPKGFAKPATREAIAKVEALKANDLTNKKIQEDLLHKNLETIKNITLTIKEKANEKGHLFAGVTKEILAKEIQKTTKFNIDPDCIKLDKHLKEVGEHKVAVEILNKKAEFTVVIVAE